MQADRSRGKSDASWRSNESWSLCSVVGNVAGVAKGKFTVTVFAPAIQVSKLRNYASIRWSHVVLRHLATVWHWHWGRNTDWFCIAVAECESVAPAPEVITWVNSAPICVSTLNICDAHVIRKFNPNRYSRGCREVTTNVVVAPAVRTTGNSTSTNRVVFAGIYRRENFSVWKGHLGRRADRPIWHIR